MQQSKNIQATRLHRLVKKMGQTIVASDWKLCRGIDLVVQRSGAPEALVMQGEHYGYATQMHKKHT